MSDSREEYKVSEEIVDAFDDAVAQRDCRDSCIKSFFGYRRAAYFSKRMSRSFKKAWCMVYSVYPDLKGTEIYYNTEKQAVYIKDE